MVSIWFVKHISLTHQICNLIEHFRPKHFTQICLSSFCFGSFYYCTFWLNFSSSYGQDNFYQFNKNTSPNLIRFTWFWFKCVIKHFHQHKYQKKLNFVEVLLFLYWINYICFQFFKSFYILFLQSLWDLFKCLFSIFSTFMLLYIFFLIIYYLLQNWYTLGNEIDLNINLTNKKYFVWINFSIEFHLSK